MPDIHGNIEGVRKSTLAELQTLYDFPIERDEYLPIELARLMGRYSCALNREISLYITRDGETHPCRPVHQIGAHATGWNDKSIGICYEGGLDENGRIADTRTYAQKCALLDLLRQLKTDYPKAKILGHYQLSENVRKACPCFDAATEYSQL